MAASIVRVRSSLFLLAALCGSGWAQQPIGTVGVRDATVVGALEVSNGRAILLSNTTVTARDHAAEVALSRGGSVLVCATSGLHATAGKTADGTTQAPLVLALDRGAIEVKTSATANDVVMTPDLRFTLREDGPLDLQLRVTRNGDTCVENRGGKAPTLSIKEQFGDATYELRAGQHVMFEHGSLKEVVDHETSSCGCPPEPSMSVADALLNPATPGAGKTVEEQHPFPAAVSEGLAPAAKVPAVASGTVHAQVSATLSSGDSPDSTTQPGAAASASASGKVPATSAAAVAGGSPPMQSSPVQPAQQKTGFVHAVGRFFKKIFGGG
jgi:hypothetical protein